MSREEGAMERIGVGLSIVVFIIMVLPSFVLAQSTDEGERLWAEAYDLEQNAKTAGDSEAALEKYKQAIAIFEKVGYRKGVGRISNSAGYIYYSLGRHNKAIEYYENSLEIARKLDDLWGEGQTLNDIGLVYNSLGQHSKAIEYFEKSLDVAKKIGDEGTEGLTLNNLGLAFLALGEFSKAAEYCKKSLQVRGKGGDLKGEVQSLNSLGNIYKGWGEYSKAVEYYQRSLDLTRQVGDVSGEGQTLNNLGLVYSALGKNGRAIGYFEDSLEIKKKTGDSKGEGLILNNLGLVHSASGEYSKAINYYEKSLEVRKKVGDLKEEGQTLENLGNIYLARGPYPKAVEYYEKSLDIARKVSDVTREGQALNKLGLVHYSWGQYPKAIEYHEKCLEIRRKVGDSKGEGTTLNDLGNVYAAWGQYSKATECYQQSLDISKKFGDVRGEGAALNNFGMINHFRGEYVKAADYYEKSLEIFRKIGDVGAEGTTLNNLGVVYKDWGQYSKAVDHYGQSLEIRKRIGDLNGEGGSLNNLGRVYFFWGRYIKAIEYYEQSLEIRRRLGDLSGEGQALANLGNVYKAWGQYSKAIECYQQSLEIKKNIDDLRGEGVILGDLGNVYATQGQYSEALSILQKALQISRKIGVPTDSATDNIGNLYLDIGEIKKAEPFLIEAGFDASLGRLCLLKADYSSAKKHYESLVKSSEQNRNTDNLFIAYTGTGVALENMGDDHRAAEYFRKAIDLTEDLRSALNASERGEFYNVRIWGFYRTAPYEGLARVLIKLNRPLDALRESEYTKARMFAEGLSKRAEGSTPEVSKDVVDLDSQLDEQLAALTKNLQRAYEKGNKDSIAVLELQVNETKIKLAKHVETLRREYPLFAATKYPKPMGLDQATLEVNEWVLVYHVTDSGIIIYLTKGKNLVKAVFKPIAVKEIDELIRSFRQPLEIGPKDKLEDKLKSFDFDSGKKLSDLLVADILSFLPKDSPVIIVPDGPLGMLPYEMLVLNDKGVIKTDGEIPYVSGAEFFGDRNLISYYQSLTALTLARIYSKRKSTEGGLLCIADPVYQEKDARMAGIANKTVPTGVLSSLFKRLNLMAAENDPQMSGLQFSRLALTSELAKALSETQKSSDVYTGFDASKTNFFNNVSPSLNRYDKVVFATHGYFGSDLPGIMEPVLALTLVPAGTDGFLRMSEVMGLNMNADIVALTACQTGLGKRVSGEGTMGMGRAFQYAGAKSALMSLWSVSEFTSVNLVKRFFQSVSEGKSKLEALALARREVRNKGFDHPFFWAPFILVGETN
jgi:tetratricopeptide (TPR) repeat protein